MILLFVIVIFFFVDRKYRMPRRVFNHRDDGHHAGSDRQRHLYETVRRSRDPVIVACRNGIGLSEEDRIYRSARLAVHRNGTCPRFDPFDGADGQKQLPECNRTTAAPKARRTGIARRALCGAVARHIQRTQRAHRSDGLRRNAGASARGRQAGDRGRDRTT